MAYLLLLLGFPLLLAGAHYLVTGASVVARRFGISELIVGLTIVSMGTSAPELVVSTLSAGRGATDLAVGNIVGSNLSNLLLILGVSAVIKPMAMDRGVVWREIPFALLATLVLAALANDTLLSGAPESVLDRGDGLALLGYFAIFLYYLASTAKDELSEQEAGAASMTWAVVMIVGGSLGLMLGGEWIVDGAVVMAENLGFSQAFIGLTVLALGTSLPELAASVVAASRGSTDMAIGNIVGSNIFNVLWILGVTSLISPLAFNPALNSDIWFLCGVTVLFFAMAHIGPGFHLDRREGALFLVLYAAYIVYIAIRG